MQFFSGLLLVCDSGHGGLEVNVFLRQDVQCLRRFLIDIIGLVVCFGILSVGGMEAPFATVEQSMELLQSPHHGLLLCSNIYSRAPAGFCCLTARGFVRKGPSLVLVTGIQNLNSGIGPGLGLYPLV